MATLHTIHAIAVPFAADTVDTDQIFPARFMSRDRRDGGLSDCFFHDLRYDAAGAPRPECIFNHPLLQGARILVAAANYGVGSGRPGAVLSHLDFGIRAVIAESFGPVFSAVAYKSGLLTIELARATVAELRAQINRSPGIALTIDLDGERIRSPERIDIPFAIDPFVKRIISEGRSETDLTLTKASSITVLEERQRRHMPWLFTPGPAISGP